MLTFDIKWIAPIRVGVLEDDVIFVEGPMQALSLLHDDWPTLGGKHHQVAIQECKAACHEVGKSERAREAFTAAALEAGILFFAPSRSRKQPLRLLSTEVATAYALPI